MASPKPPIPEWKPPPLPSPVEEEKKRRAEDAPAWSPPPLPEPVEPEPFPKSYLGFEPSEAEETKRSLERRKVQTTADLKGRDAGLARLHSLWGKRLNLSTPQEMEAYLLEEAKKPGAQENKLLTSPEAHAFFRFEARVRGETPHTARPEDALRAFQRGEAHQKYLQGIGDWRSSQLQRAPGGSAEDQYLLVTPSEEKARSTAITRSEQEESKELSSSLAGTEEGNLLGLRVKGTTLEKAQAYVDENADPEVIEAFGLEELPTYEVLGLNFHEKTPVSRIRIYQVPAFEGRKAVNLAAHESEIAYLHLANLALDAGFRSEREAAQKLSEEERKALGKRARELAQEDLAAIQNQGHDSVLYLDNPNKVVKEIAKGEDPLAYVSPWLQTAGALRAAGVISEETYQNQVRRRAPWAAVWYPPSLRAFNEGTVYYGQVVEDLSPGMFHYLTSPTVSSVVSSYALSPDPKMTWGSLDHMKSARKTDYMAHLGEVGDKLFPFLPGSLRAPAAFMLGMVEPDLFSGPFLVAGAAKKTLKAGSQLAIKATTGADTFTEGLGAVRAEQTLAALDKLEEGFKSGAIQDFSEGVELLRANGLDEVADLHEAFLVAKTAGITPTSLAGRRSYSPVLDDLYKKQEKLQENISALEKELPEDAVRYLRNYGEDLERVSKKEDPIGLVAFPEGVPDDLQERIWEGLRRGEVDEAVVRELEDVLEKFTGEQRTKIKQEFDQARKARQLARQKDAKKSQAVRAQALKWIEDPSWEERTGARPTLFPGECSGDY